MNEDSSPEKQPFHVDYSLLHGGWCAYEQDPIAGYRWIAGPFENKSQANAALAKRIKENKDVK